MHAITSSRPARAALVLLAAAVLAACPKATADLELRAAQEAIEQARANKAADCAQETYQAAEAAIAQAKQLAEAGEIDAAKEKANQATSLAAQAHAASAPGCDEEETRETAEGPTERADGEETNTALALNLEDMPRTVYFDYNQSTIREDSKAVLSKIAEALALAPQASLEIEGHCDVRGSTEYNLHLGERRAYAVRKYLLAQGVTEKQLRVISYGEERPIDLGLSEEAHQKNRRAELNRL